MFTDFSDLQTTMLINSLIKIFKRSTDTNHYQKLVSYLVFNGTLSTNRLHRAIGV